MASAVPSQQTGVRASSNHEAIRMSFCRTQRGSITCMLRTKVVSSFAKSAKVVLVLQDNPERRMWLLYAY